MTRADSVLSTPPLNTSSRQIKTRLALQEARRQRSIVKLRKLRDQARAEIDRLLTFLDASDPYVTTELEDDISVDLEVVETGSLP